MEAGVRVELRRIDGSLRSLSRDFSAPRIRAVHGSERETRAGRVVHERALFRDGRVSGIVDIAKHCGILALPSILPV